MNGCSSRLVIGVLSALALGAVVTFRPVKTTGRERAEESNAWAKYEIILERNIFSRNRRPKVDDESRERREETPAVVNPESYYRLKGLVQEDGAFIAFVEDTRYGNVLRLREGQTVARGLVKNLTLDSLEYEYNDKTVVIDIGRDLEGGFGAVTQSELMEWSPTETTSGSTTSEPATGDEADILEQLRQRRQQQLGR